MYIIVYIKKGEIFYKKKIFVNEFVADFIYAYVCTVGCKISQAHTQYIYLQIYKISVHFIYK